MRPGGLGAERRSRLGRDAASAGPFSASLSATALDGGSGFKVTGAWANSWLGGSVALADVNGDGLADVVVGAPLNSVPNGTWAGAAFVVFGRDVARGATFPAVLDVKTLNGANGFRYDGSTGERVGFSVGFAGDLDGDGRDDLVIGAPYGSPSGSTARGAVFVLFGRGGGFPGYLTAALSTRRGTRDRRARPIGWSRVQQRIGNEVWEDERGQNVR